MRRHSLAVPSGNLLQVPPAVGPGAGAVAEDVTPVSIDHLSLPKIPMMSSRRSSLRSTWSELEALASRRQSQESITLPDE